MPRRLLQKQKKKEKRREGRFLRRYFSFETDASDVFGKEVISRLNETDMKFFARANKACRDIVGRAKKDDEAERKLKFRVSELLSTSTLEWAWEEGFPFDAWGRKKERFISYVVLGGNVDLLRWLREVKSCPWNEGTCSLAAMNGHLVCLQYLHENGCP